VRQGDAIGGVAAVNNAELSSNDLGEGRQRQELGKGQFPDRKDKGGMEKGELALEPVRTSGDFVGVGNSVAAFGAFAGEAAANGGEINPITSFLLGPAQGFGEPFEKSFARRPCKRPAEHGLLVARGLANEQDAAGDRPAEDNGLVHAGAAVARAQSGKVGVEGGSRQ